MSGDWFPLTSQPAANRGNFKRPLLSVWTAIGLWQIALISRHPQMVPAVGKAWHRVVAAEQRRGLIYAAERPAALAVIELEQ